MRPLATHSWLHHSFFLVVHYTRPIEMASFLFLRYVKHVPTSVPLLLQDPLPGNLLLSLIHISAYMTSPHQENFLHHGSTEQQDSAQLMINDVCPALFFSGGLICYLGPGAEPVHRGPAVWYTLLSNSACSVMSGCGLILAG